MNIKDALKLIKVTGDEADKFLQGQITCDIKQVDDQHLQLGAHCNVKGRIESLFEIFTIDATYYLLMPASIVDHALELLKKYGRFSKIELSLASLDEVSPPVVLPADFTTWRAEHIENGIPVLFPETIDTFLPHDLNLPQLGAVSFTKGCYLGQEIVARMQHLGNPKRHMQHSDISGTPGDKLENGDIIVDCIANSALVVTKI